MIYQCYGCKKLFDEDDGAIVIANELIGPVPQLIPLSVFKCKKCIGEKGRKIIERIQLEKGNE